MIIKKMAVGNTDEAFIEKGFSTGVNIISSDDNNKGKTIVIQSIMYAIGNEPVFPHSFEYDNYYHYVEFEHNNIVYRICRYNSSFVLAYGSVLMIFDNVSELKRYWTKYIFPFPQIHKNQILKVVDPVLFFQLFFVGQDKKDTSNIANAGLYNKQDFYNMIYDICNASGLSLNDEEIKTIKSELKELKEERESILKQYKILKSNKKAITYLSSTSDKSAFSRKLSELETIKTKITELKKSRNNFATRKSKWETTIKELNSLNRTIDFGELHCMDCNSTNISFSTSKKTGYTFDISTVEMRTEIIKSIQDKINSYDEEIEKVSAQITDAQGEMKRIMREEDISLESIVAFKEEIFNANDAEQKINELDKKISELNNQLKVSTDFGNTTKEKQEEILKSIVSQMNEVYKIIDFEGTEVFSDIFTKKGVTYSGSEATVFHILKIYAFAAVLKHFYPIIIDSFRAEDLSTPKENKVLNLFSQLQNQVILTTTLKNEELGKYNGLSGINHIDYSNHTPSKILSSSFLNEFKALLSELSIKI